MGSKARFKVGDRVRFTDRCLVSWWFGPHTENKEGEIVSPDTSFGYRWSVKVGDRYGHVDDDHIEPATLTIREGHYYRTRDGRKVGPMKMVDGHWSPNRGMHWYNDDGSRVFGDNDGTVIISEWVDDPATPAAPTDTTGYTVPMCAYEDAGGLFELKNGKVTFRTQTIRVSSKQPAIVCLIENGKPRPATRPYVHPDRASAEREARRLAANNKGKEFAVYNCVYTAKVEPAYKHEWQRLAAGGRKIAAIKEMRSITGLGLWAAGRAVEHWLAYDEPYSRLAA